VRWIDGGDAMWFPVLVDVEDLIERLALEAKFDAVPCTPIGVPCPHKGRGPSALLHKLAVAERKT
jgi:hypothetical protein